MNLSTCVATTATATFKDGSTQEIELQIGKPRATNSADGYCRILKSKGVIKGCLSEPIDDVSGVTSIEFNDETWEVYHPPTYGCDHCKWMWVFRLRRVWLPCQSESEICECFKDPECDGGFYAIKKFDVTGAIRKMNLSERVVDGVRQNFWTYRYYSAQLNQICNLENLRRILVKHDGEDYRIVSANFDGDCPYAEVEKEKTQTEIIEPDDG